ncbi:DUF502 domain-containing protein [Neptunicella marina]|uniref:DUF502 domain-containing protein n=1 Tax=Neptunicella marina TaxID=2125989 RepID=A0A8J6M1S4_9ALTE|nr:DUF502 domain-containing protein [Neptunicella marina]MBC3765697.1 DUF502 domain-containing protein [Neptunicella marina]
MNKLAGLILKGLVAVLPLALTLYFLYWLVSSLELLLEPVIPPQFYMPGLGLLTALLLLILVGLVVNFYGIRWLISIGNTLLTKIPLIKSLYGAIQDILTVFNLSRENKMQSVVSVDMGNDIALIGFITGELTGQKLYPGEERVGVYIPLSYQIGGYTIYVHRDKLTPLNISVEEAMRLTLTGGVQAAKPKA